MGKCVRHGADFIRNGVCMAFQSDREQRIRANALVLCFIALLALVALTVDWWAPLLGL